MIDDKQMALLKKLVLFIVLLSALSVLAYVPSQSDFIYIISTYTLAFIAYYFLIKLEWSVPELLLGGAIIRLALLPAFPNLSDDIYRFIWDGNLITEGENPYIHLPSDISSSFEWASTNGELYSNMNSPEYYTIYPPVNQLIFALSSFLGGGKLYSSMLVMKMLLFISEMATIFVLLKMLRDNKLKIASASFYAYNPLVINEIMTNMHFEGMMLLFLLIGLVMLQKKKWLQSVFAVSISIGIKLIPLMFMPLLIAYLGVKKSFRYFMGLGLALLVIFTPILINLPFFMKSLDLYFQKFEFNASIYYISRWFGYQLYGYNQIAKLGPILAISTIGIIVWLTRKLYLDNKKPLATYCLYAICAYLFLATTVHPWYIIPVIGICTLTRFRFPLFWSFFITFTYINYSYSPYEENLWFVAFEYMTLLAIIVVETSIPARIRGVK
jgi:hypothetical protein